MCDLRHLGTSVRERPDDEWRRVGSVPRFGTRCADGCGRRGVVMTRTYTVHLRRTWDERYAITVEAASPAEALQKANLEEDNVDFNWNNVEAAAREVMFIDDAQTGEQVYSLDDDVQADTAAAVSAISS